MFNWLWIAMRICLFRSWFIFFILEAKLMWRIKQQMYEQVEHPHRYCRFRRSIRLTASWNYWCTRCRGWWYSYAKFYRSSLCRDHPWFGRRQVPQYYIGSFHELAYGPPRTVVNLIWSCIFATLCPWGFEGMCHEALLPVYTMVHVDACDFHVVGETRNVKRTKLGRLYIRSFWSLSLGYYEYIVSLVFVRARLQDYSCPDRTLACEPSDW
jgi:hypothetical protein